MAECGHSLFIEEKLKKFWPLLFSMLGQKKKKSLKTKKSEAEIKKLIFIKKSVVQRVKAS